MSLVLLSSRLTYEQSIRDGGGHDIDLAGISSCFIDLKRLLSGSIVRQVVKPSSLGRIELLLYRLHTSKYLVLDIHRDFSLTYQGIRYTADPLLRLAVSHGKRILMALLYHPMKFEFVLFS